MKPNQVAVCGVTLSLAVAMYVVVLRSRAHRRAAASSSSSSSSATTTVSTTSASGATTTTTTTTKKTVRSAEAVTFFQKDEAAEAARIASDQEFATGTLVKVHGHGAGKVLHFIPESKSYKVELHEHGKTAPKTVPLIHISHIKVKELFVYPIKSCRGIKLDHAVITPRGIANDRNWMFVDAKGKFITQRRYPTMALIAPQLDDVENPTVLTLTAPGMDDLRVPIVLEGHGHEVATEVWGDKAVGIDQGAAAAEWVNKFLADVLEDRKLKLIRVKDSAKRPTDAKYAPGHETVFADGFPFLVACDSSLAEVNEQLKEKIAIDRFRANIILTGAPGFADENWNCFTIGGLRFRNVKPCSRCKMPTIDQEKGEAHPDREPQKTMTTFRNGVALDFVNGSDKDYYFGSNLVAEDAGRLSVGAPVKVLTTKEAVFA